jgi:hypothetical protein
MYCRSAVTYTNIGWISNKNLASPLSKVSYEPCSHWGLHVGYDAVSLGNRFPTKEAREEFLFRTFRPLKMETICLRYVGIRWKNDATSCHRSPRTHRRESLEDSLRYLTLHKMMYQQIQVNENKCCFDLTTCNTHAIFSVTFINLAIKISERLKTETLVYSKLEYCCSLILSAFTKLRKASTNFVIYLSVCTSVRMEQLVSHWTDLHVIWCLSIL